MSTQIEIPQPIADRFVTRYGETEATRRMVEVLRAHNFKREKVHNVPDDAIRQIADVIEGIAKLPTGFIFERRKDGRYTRREMRPVYRHLVYYVLVGGLGIQRYKASKMIGLSHCMYSHAINNLTSLYATDKEWRRIIEETEKFYNITNIEKSKH